MTGSAEKTAGKMSYRATFSDGQVITRKSDREYNAAWRMVVSGCKPTDSRVSADGIFVKTGFSKTKELAQAARLRDAPSEYDNERRKWVSEPERIVSFEVVETEYLG